MTLSSVLSQLTMGNPRTVLQRWLSEYKGLTDDQIANFAANLSTDSNYYTALEKAITEMRTCDDLSPICNQLHSFYRSDESKLCRFVIELIPVLIGAYMNATADTQSRTAGRTDVLETCLLSLHNLFVTEENSTKETVPGGGGINFRIPGIGYSSVFHDGITRPEIKETMSELITSQPCFTLLDCVNETNRFFFLYALVSKYTSLLPSLSPASQAAFCQMCRHIVALDSKPRIQLSSDFLVEMVCGVYQVLFLHKSPIAFDVLYDVERRATFELMHEPLLIVNGIRNSLDTNPSGKPTDGPIGISLAPTTAIRHPSISAITNASFRPEKLPEDIPIQNGGGGTSGAGGDGGLGGLGAVAEQHEAESSLDHDRIEIEVKDLTTTAKDSSKLSKFGSRLKRGSDRDKTVYTPLVQASPKGGINNNDYNSGGASTGSGFKKSTLRSSFDDSDCDESGPNVLFTTRSGSSKL